MAELRPSLEAEVRTAKSEELFNDAVEKMDALAYESSDLTEGAKQYGLTIQTSALFTQQGGEGIAGNRKVLQAAFSDDVLKDGKNSSAIALDNQHSVWLRLNKHEPSRIRSLAEVTPEIKLSLELDKASLLAKAQADAISTALNNGKSAAEVAANYKVQWQDFLATSRNATAPVANLLKVAFRLPAPKTDAIWTAKTTPSGKDFAVVALSKVTVGASTLTDDQKKQFMVSLANARGQQDFQDYVTYLRSKAKIQNEEKKKETE
jgi:peptidyl-prolyl cis-trans isomerase D